MKEEQSQPSPESSSLQHQLTEALAACKGKDKALGEIARNYAGRVAMIAEDALALQPSSTAPSDYLREETKELVDAYNQLRDFVRYATLEIQVHRGRTEAQKDALFQKAYRLYVSHNVESKDFPAALARFTASSKD